MCKDRMYLRYVNSPCRFKSDSNITFLWILRMKDGQMAYGRHDVFRLRVRIDRDHARSDGDGSQAGHALLYRQRFIGDVTTGAKGLLPRSHPVSAHAYRHRLEVSRDDRVP